MYFSGYTFDEEGIRIWPLKSLKGRWQHLRSIQVVVASEQSGPRYRTVFSFFDTKKVITVLSRFRKPHLEALKLAVDHASDDVLISDKVHFLLKWGSEVALLRAVKREYARTRESKVGIALANM